MRWRTNEVAAACDACDAESDTVALPGPTRIGLRLPETDREGTSNRVEPTT